VSISLSVNVNGVKHINLINALTHNRPASFPLDTEMLARTDGRTDGRTPYHNTTEVSLRAYKNKTHRFILHYLLKAALWLLKICRILHSAHVRERKSKRILTNLNRTTLLVLNIRNVINRNYFK